MRSVRGGALRLNALVCDSVLTVFIGNLTGTLRRNVTRRKLREHDRAYQQPTQNACCTPASHGSPVG